MEQRSYRQVLSRLSVTEPGSVTFSQGRGRDEDHDHREAAERHAGAADSDRHASRVRRKGHFFFSFTESDFLSWPRGGDSLVSTC